MAKVRRQHTAVTAFDSLLSAINKVAEVELGGGELTPEAKQEALEAVQQSTAVIGESNFRTVMENTDDAIELQHQIAEAQEAELAHAVEAQEAQEADADAEAEQE